ncbi:MAG: Pr6Pr family membrane protein [Streptococcus sp.]|nr:Pr6Pr family membrane protein [Streptococcus sp.]
MKQKLILFYRIVLLISVVTGVYIEIADYGWGKLMYYTILSNIVVLFFTAYLVYLMIANLSWENSKVLRLKGGVTMCIMITCVVYHFLLAPRATNFFQIENLLCHYIVPLLFFFDTLFFDKRRQYRWYDPISWTSVPLIYTLFALFNGFVTKISIPGAKDNPFPYFFLNVFKYGWPFVIKMSFIILIAYLLSSYVFYFIKSIRVGNIGRNA